MKLARILSPSRWEREKVMKMVRSDEESRMQEPLIPRTLFDAALRSVRYDM